MVTLVTGIGGTPPSKTGQRAHLIADFRNGKSVFPEKSRATAPRRTSPLGRVKLGRMSALAAQPGRCRGLSTGSPGECPRERKDAVRRVSTQREAGTANRASAGTLESTGWSAVPPNARRARLVARRQGSERIRPSAPLLLQETIRRHAKSRGNPAKRANGRIARPALQIAQIASLETRTKCDLFLREAQLIADSSRVFP